ncbi:hypothetical protein FLJC2902T_05260 [Flavobacterium limnosediminis JC2902]|uniref:Competence protein n=1 Tax=Flavobacterium limnosediminis JC2902 TaxID=1341181 RepID=V6T042_9FLAO|nr:hypothetical protein [Flavobacterium limnosediminis]ESU30035.1 hypothetical protein FLJC2902T_05260 [Flavobacterium limnosediminis JC2902]
MPFENLKEKADDIQDHLKNAIDSTIAYYKLWLFKVIMKSTTMVVKVLLMSLLFLFFLLFTSVALALYLGQLTDNYVLGFLIVGGIYVVLLLIAYFIKDKIVEGNVLEKFSKVFFNE